MADLARIKRNVAKMAAQSAPEADIDGYITSEGVTVDDVRTFKAETAATKQQPTKVTPDITAAADAYEKARGTGAFAAATDAGASGIPFSDELYSAVSALPNAAISAVQGKGFHPVDEYNKSQDLQAELTRRRTAQHPVASVAGSVAGGMAFAAPAAKAGFSLMQGAKPTLASMAGRGAAEGAGYGALYGAGEGEGLEDRTLSAARGGVAGGAVGGAFGALGRIGAGKIDKSAIPSVDDLRTAGQAAYQQADQAGVIFTPDAVNRLKMDIGKKLVDIGYDPALQPGAAAVVKRIEDLAGQNVTLTGLDSLRKVAGNGFVPGNKSNNKAVSDIIGAIDDLVSAPKPNELMSGNAKQASDALKTARDMWSRLSKSERVTDAISRAELRAASTGSGGNVDNAIRQNLRRIVENPRGFSKPEQEALKKAVEGSSTQNALRLAGKLSPSGNGLMAALGIGGTMVNPLVGVASLGGMGAKTVADGLTRNQTSIVNALIRSGGSLPAAQVTPIRKAIVDALTRGTAQQLPGYTSR